MTEKWVCIVDAYSTGAALAETFRLQGWKVIHVRSQPEAPKLLAKTFHEGTFTRQFDWEPSDSEKLLLKLKLLDVKAVIAGSEPGVTLADELSDRLGLPGNDQSKGGARRDKDAMAEALRAAGLATAEFAVTQDHDQAIEAAVKIGGWPVVAKPINAAGSEDVYVCHTPDDVSLAFSAIYKKENMLGIPNCKVMVQEYLSGVQYMCNSVSIAGRHYVTEIWRVQRKIIPNVGVLHDRESIVPHRGADQDIIVPYVKKALTAVGIREGASNTELMLTRRGPVLIETSARTQGGIHSPALETALGQSHATSTFLSYADPAAFRRQLAGGYRVRKNVMVVHLIAGRHGWVAERRLERLHSLKSFHSVKGIPEVGAYIDRTMNLVTSVGRVHLLHDDPVQLELDYQQIRDWEDTEPLITLVNAGPAVALGPIHAPAPIDHLSLSPA